MDTAACMVAADADCPGDFAAVLAVLVYGKPYAGCVSSQAELENGNRGHKAEHERHASMLVGFGMIAVMAAAAWLMTRLRLPMEAALAADVALLVIGNGFGGLNNEKIRICNVLFTENIQINQQNVTKMRAFLAIL